MDYRRIGMILLLSSIIISGVEKFIFVDKSADIFRSNISASANYLNKAYGVIINATLLSSYSRIIVIVLATIEIGLCLLLLKINKGNSLIPWFLLSIYLFCYSFVYYNPEVVQKSNKSLRDFYERMFFFNILIILGLFIIAGSSKYEK